MSLFEMSHLKRHFLGRQSNVLQRVCRLQDHDRLERRLRPGNHLIKLNLLVSDAMPK
jgi:hypothetical protein